MKSAAQRRRSLAVPLCLIVAGQACQPADTDGTWAGSVDTLPDGRIVVENPSVGYWGPGETWHVTEEFVIGSLEEPGPELFGSISALHVDDAERIWVADGDAQEIRVFDASGNHVRTVGGEGDGPGEYRYINGMTAGPGGTTWVVDPAATRVSVLDSSGMYVGSHRVAAGVVTATWRGGLTPDGRFFHDGSRGLVDGPPQLLLVEYDSLMHPVDTLVPPRLAGGLPTFVNPRGSASATVPFTPQIVWRFDEAGFLWSAHTGTYEVTKQALDGDTLLHFRRDYLPLSVTHEDVDRALEDLEWFTTRGGVVDRDRIPSSLPAMVDLFVDDATRLWVLRTAPEERAGRLFDVFAADGIFLGEVLLPVAINASPPPVFRGSFVYAVTEDDLGVARVVKARIVRGG